MTWRRLSALAIAFLLVTACQRTTFHRMRAPWLQLYAIAAAGGRVSVWVISAPGQLWEVSGPFSAGPVWLRGWTPYAVSERDGMVWVAALAGWRPYLVETRKGLVWVPGSHHLVKTRKGLVWVPGSHPHAWSIMRISRDGEPVRAVYPLNERDQPGQIAVDERGRPWFTQPKRNEVSYITRAGAVVAFASTSACRHPTDIAVTDVDVYVISGEHPNFVCQINRSSRHLRAFPFGAAEPQGIAADDLAAWITTDDEVWRLSESGKLKKFTLPYRRPDAHGIVLVHHQPWFAMSPFTGDMRGAVGSIGADGVVRVHATPSMLYYLAYADHMIWGIGPGADAFLKWRP